MKRTKTGTIVIPALFGSIFFIVLSCSAANSAIGLYLPFLPGNVVETPVVTASSASVFVDESITLTASGSGEGAVYTWTVAAGEGTIDSTGETVTYSAPSTAGDATITCVASITDMKDSDAASTELTIRLKILTTPSISGQTYILPGDSATLTAAGSEAGSTYNWSVTGGGSIDATGSSVTYTAPASEGTASISCYATLSGFTDSTAANYSLPVRDNHFALLISTTVSGGSTNINQASVTEMEWTSVSLDSTYFTLTDSTNLQVEQAGSYFLALTIPMVTALQRSAVKAEVYVNGSAVEGSIAESSYVRNSSAHNQSSDHVALFLHNLSVGDDIDIRVNAGSTAGTVTIDSEATLYVEYVDSARPLFSATATRTTNSTNLNQNTAYSLEWTEVFKDNGYTHSNSTNPEDIVLDQAGYYLVFVNIPVNTLLTATQRCNVKMLVRLNGSLVTGGEAQQGYIRNTSAHRNSSIHWSGLVYSPSAGGILEVLTQRESSAGSETVTMSTNKASIHIEKVDPSGYLLFSQATSLTGGSDWNPLAAQEIEWDTDTVIDTANYTHDTVTAPESITLAKAGDYLLIYNDSLTNGGTAGTTIRLNPKIQVRINGLPVSGAETKSHYMRYDAADGNRDSSGSLVYYLDSLSAGDILSLSTEQEGEAGAANDSDNARLILIRKK